MEETVQGQTMRLGPPTLKGFPKEPWPEFGRKLTNEQVNDCRRLIAYYASAGRPLSRVTADLINDAAAHLMCHVVAMANELLALQRETVGNDAIRAFAEAIGTDIVILRYKGQDGRHCAFFKGCEVKEGDLLGSLHGNATTSEGALADYGRQIAGKRLVFDAMQSERREYDAPASFGPTK